VTSPQRLSPLETQQKMFDPMTGDFSPKWYIGTFITYFVYRKTLASYAQYLRWLALLLVFVLVYHSTRLSLIETITKIQTTQTIPQICLDTVDGLKPKDISLTLILEFECIKSYEWEAECKDIILSNESDTIIQFESSESISTLKWLLQFKKQVVYITTSTLQKVTMGQMISALGLEDRVILKSTQDKIESQKISFIETSLEFIKRDLAYVRGFTEDLVVIRFVEGVDKNDLVVMFQNRPFEWITSPLSGLVIAGSINLE
jgi:hypothetical protein